MKKPLHLFKSVFFIIVLERTKKSAISDPGFFTFKFKTCVYLYKTFLFYHLAIILDALIKFVKLKAIA